MRVEKFISEANVNRKVKPPVVSPIVEPQAPFIEGVTWKKPEGYKTGYIPREISKPVIQTRPVTRRYIKFFEGETRSRIEKRGFETNRRIELRRRPRFNVIGNPAITQPAPFFKDIFSNQNRIVDSKFVPPDVKRNNAIKPFVQNPPIPKTSPNFIDKFLRWIKEFFRS